MTAVGVLGFPLLPLNQQNHHSASKIYVSNTPDIPLDLPRSLLKLCSLLPRSVLITLPIYHSVSMRVGFVYDKLSSHGAIFTDRTTLVLTHYIVYCRLLVSADMVLQSPLISWLSRTYTWYAPVHLFANHAPHTHNTDDLCRSCSF